MDLGYLVDLYVNDGYEIIDATHKVAQDIILLKISKCLLSNNVTIKGGVVMHSISKNKLFAQGTLFKKSTVQIVI